MPTITLQYTDAEHAELEVEAKRQGKTLHHYAWATLLLVARAQERLTALDELKRGSVLRGDRTQHARCPDGTEDTGATK